jgi:hypothetical protein
MILLVKNKIKQNPKKLGWNGQGMEQIQFCFPGGGSELSLQEILFASFFFLN